MTTSAIAIYDKELPLQSGSISLLDGLDMPSCIRDAAPDAWGRRVIINRTLGLKGTNTDTAQLDELTYLLESGSDRIGALDFQASPTEYVSRSPINPKLDELLESVEQGRAGNTASQAMLIHGSNNLSQLQNCLDTAHNFHLSQSEAVDIIEHQKGVIESQWDAVCDEAKLSEIDKRLLWGRQFLNPFIFERYSWESNGLGGRLTPCDRL